MLLVLVELGEAGLTEPSRQALTAARGLADHGGVEAACIGDPPPPVREGLARAGVARVHAITAVLLDDYAADGWAEALWQLVTALRPAGVLAAGTQRGNEVLAGLAARAGLPLATGCVALAGAPDGSGADSPWQVTRLRWGGMLLEDAELDAPVKLATLAPHALAAADADAPGAAAVCAFTPALSPEHARAKVVAREEGREGVTLTTAPVVVAGGRGVGSAAGFAVLEELAELLGGAVGCSRVATSNGWRPHTDQVGQTGATVAPKLYIACGISGATQHWAGCKNAGRILAINTDSDAPMVRRADYAVIGDLHEVLGAVVTALRARAGARPTAAFP